MMITTYKNDHCIFKICHQRGQILSWQPHGHKDVLWCTGEQFISLNKPIRGGIPLCWPWFSKGEHNDLTPSHGFARISDWTLVEQNETDDGCHRLVYQLTSDDVAPEFSVFGDFCIRLEYVIGSRLSVRLNVNGLKGNEPPTSFGALHTYLGVGDIHSLNLEGLGDTSINNLNNFKKQQEPAVLSVNGPTEKRFAYEASGEHVVKIHDTFNGRVITLKQKSHSDVMLWSPWDATGKSITDAHSDDYLRFVCVETAAICRSVGAGMFLEISIN